MKRFILTLAALSAGFFTGAVQATYFALCPIVQSSPNITAVNSPRKFTANYVVTCGAGDLNSCGWEGVGRLTKNVNGTWTAVSTLTTLFPGRPCGLINANHATKDYPVGSAGQYNLAVSIVDSSTGLVVNVQDLTHTFP